MKILHTSDWHLGMSFNGINLEEDQRFFLNQIYKIIKEENIDLVVHAGDVFDRKNAPVEAYNLYDEAVTMICGELNTDMIVVAGNHDSPERLSACNQLLRKSGLYVEGILSKEVVKKEYEDVEIYLLPWFTTERVRALFPEIEEIQSLTEAYQIVCDKIRESFTPGKKHIAVSHSFVVGATTSESDRAAVVGNATLIPSSVFDGFDYVALGHIHGPQSITEKIRYCGTPMMYSFGNEEKQEKSVTIVDTDTMSIRSIPLELLHNRYTFSGNYKDILEGEYSESQLNGYIRLEIQDIYVGLEAQAMLRSKFKNLLELKSRTFDDENATITMSIDELEEKAKDPMEIIKSYYMDVLKEELVDEHIIELFNEALQQYNEGEVE